MSAFHEKLLALATPRHKPEPEAAPGMPFASFNRRMVAAMLDSMLILLLIAPVLELVTWSLYGPVQFDYMGTMQRVQQAPPAEAGIIWAAALRDSGLLARWLFSSVLQLAVLGAVTIYFWGHWAATPGKMICRIAILDAVTLKPISKWQSLLRFFAYFVSTIPLMAGFFAIAFDKRRQGWHDKIARTVAVVIPKKKSEGENA